MKADLIQRLEAALDDEEFGLGGGEEYVSSDPAPAPIEPTNISVEIKPTPVLVETKPTNTAPAVVKHDTNENKVISSPPQVSATIQVTTDVAKVISKPIVDTKTVSAAPSAVPITSPVTKIVSITSPETKVVSLTSPEVKAAAVAVSAVHDDAAEKLAQRAARFGIVKEEQKLNQRAERFGLPTSPEVKAQAATVTGLKKGQKNAHATTSAPKSAELIAQEKALLEKLKEREKRFGASTVKPSSLLEQAKKEDRKKRFLSAEKTNQTNASRYVNDAYYF